MLDINHNSLNLNYEVNNNNYNSIVDPNEFIP